MIRDSEEVIHGPFPLWRRHVGTQIQIVHGKCYELVKLGAMAFAAAEPETLETDDQNGRELPNIHLFDSRLMLLAALTVPLVMSIEHLFFAVLSKTLLEGEAASTPFGLGCYRNAEVH